MKALIEKARRFATLHQKGGPIILYNIWDAGSARAIVTEGALAIATGSWSIAAAQGFEDGETIPFSFLEMIVRRITSSVDVPVSVDFEGGFAVEPSRVAEHATRLIEAGAVGINFEDQVVGGKGLHAPAAQAARIAAIRRAADETHVPLFINARTDLFLEEANRDHAHLVELARERARHYRDAGASGFFVPGLVDLELIEQICESVDLPVNAFMMPDAPPIPDLARCGVARVSFGPYPYRHTMNDLAARYRKARPDHTQ